MAPVGQCLTTCFSLSHLMISSHSHEYRCCAHPKTQHFDLVKSHVLPWILFIKGGQLYLYSFHRNVFGQPHCRTYSNTFAPRLLFVPLDSSQEFPSKNEFDVIANVRKKSFRGIFRKDSPMRRFGLCAGGGRWAAGFAFGAEPRRKRTSAFGRTNLLRCKNRSDAW